MPKARVVPHRASREDRKARELADLKRKQHRLEAERDRLRAELEKKPRKPRAAKVVQGEEPLPPGPVCCDLPMRVVDLGDHGTWLICAACKARRKCSPPVI